MENGSLLAIFLHHGYLVADLFAVAAGAEDLLAVVVAVGAEDIVAVAVGAEDLLAVAVAAVVDDLIAVGADFTYGGGASHGSRKEKC